MQLLTRTATATAPSETQVKSKPQNQVRPTNPFIEFEAAAIERGIPDRFERQVDHYPHKLAVKTKSNSITYDRLNRAANQLARTILNSTRSRGRPIALMFDPGISLVTAILGVLKAGSTWVPLDPTYPKARLDYMLADAGAALILTDNRNERFAREMASPQVQVMNTALVDQSVPDHNLDLATAPNAMATIIYTSGSTGQPKGVVYSHRSILQNISGHTNSLHISADDRLSLFASFSHLSGMSGIFRALFNGATTFPYNIKREGLIEAPDWLKRERITLFHSVPTVFRHLIETLKDNVRFPDVRLIHLGGEPVSKRDFELYQRHFSDDCILMNNFGSSETMTIAYFFMNKESTIEGSLVPVGYPAVDKEILLLDEAGQEVKSGQPGTIAVKSEFLVDGYWRKPDLTQTAFTPIANSKARIYNTGDVGRLLPDGRLIHLGRKDRQVKIRGQRVELAEIETALLTHPHLRELAVTVRENLLGDSQLVSYVAPLRNAVPSVTELRQHLLALIPQHMIPSTFIFMEALPLLPNGKINRQALPNVDQMRPAVSSIFVGPRDEIEEHLTEIWEIILGIQPIGVRDNFFDLGGHSLSSSQLLTQIYKLYGRDLPLSTLFQAPTVEQLAKLLQQGTDSKEWVSLVTLQPHGLKPPFFCLPGNLGNVYTDLKYLSQHWGNAQPLYGLQDGIQNPSNIEALARHYLREITARQPAGPYYLGGLCAGAVVAYEMAQQLRANGDAVAILALIEPAPPRGPGVRSYMSFAKTILAKVARRLGHHSSTLNRLEAVEQKAYTRLKAKLVANAWALRQYAPKPYAGKIQLIAAEESFTVGDNPLFKWQDFAEGGAEVYQLPGSHNTVTGNNDTPIDEGSMKVLAEILRMCIDTTLR